MRWNAKNIRKKLAGMKTNDRGKMIAFDCGEGRFNYRVVGVAIDDGRVLLHKAEADTFWTLPGGRGEFGEPAAHTLKREMREELHADVEVSQLLWLVENFFDYSGLAYHEIALYFLMRFSEASGVTKRDKPFYGDEKGIPLTFEWVANDTDVLTKLNVLPSFLQSGLQSLPQTLQHIVHNDRLQL